jgi:hypothetical protein
MTELIVDGNTYDTDTLPDEVKATVASIKFVEREIQTLESRIAVAKTAIGVYSSTLKGLLTDVQPLKESANGPAEPSEDE